MEMEAETGGRRPPAQGRTPGAPGSWKRRGGPSPGASAGSPALGPLDLRCLVPRTRGGWMSCLWAFLKAIPGNSRRYLQPAQARVQSGMWVGGKVRGQLLTEKTEASQTPQGSETTATLRTVARNLWLPWKRGAHLPAAGRHSGTKVRPADARYLHV